jgi:large subunit ribosomal protein L25
VSTRPQLSAERREVTGKKVSLLRRQGVLPGVVYGHGTASEPIQLDARTFDDFRRHAGRNAIVDLRLTGGGRARPVLLHQVQEHPVTRTPLHVDFLVVRMTEEMTVDVQVVMTGTSEAVDRQGGTLLHLRDTVQVRALPADLPSSLELDISVLDSFDTVLHVSDLPVPERVTLLTPGEEPLARVTPPRLEVEPTSVEAEPGAEAEGADVPAEGADATEAGAESGDTTEG